MNNLLLIFLLFSWVSCTEQQPVAKPQQSQPKSEQDSGVAAKRIIRDIPVVIDENIEGAQVSLTRNFLFVFDGSGSMNEECGNNRQIKISSAKNAVSNFLTSVPDDVNLGLLVFSGNMNGEVIEIGPDNRQKFLMAIQNITPNNRTPLGEYITLATNILARQKQRQLGYGEFRIIVVTDGEATDNLEEGVVYALERGFPIYTIGLCIPGGHSLRNWSISYRDANSEEDLQKGLEETLAELPEFDVTEFHWE